MLLVILMLLMISVLLFSVTVNVGVVGVSILASYFTVTIVILGL